MTESRKVVRVFIASPGDLVEERVGAKYVADEFNSIWGETLGYHVELVGWEDAVSVYGRPQSVINKDLEKCDLFVGMLWKRWGTPPDIAGPYTSGFQEEFEISLERRTKIGKPEISLLLKEVEQELLRDPGDDLKKVLDFRRRMVAEKKILFETFHEVSDFQSKFRRCISNYIKSLRATEAPSLTGEQLIAPANSPSNAASTDSVNSVLTVEAAEFVRNVVSKVQGSIVPWEAARFRLLGQIIGIAGNDDRSIGVHDANILFLERAALSLSNSEVVGLIDCGFENYSSENCPVWYWIFGDDDAERSMFVHSLFGTARERAGALRAMTLIGEAFPSANRDQILRSLLQEGKESIIKIAAIEYLAEWGLNSDAPLLRAEIERGDHQTRSAAASAVLNIALRNSRESALEVLIELQPENLQKSLIDKIFQSGEDLSSDHLSKCLQNRSSSVRLASVRLLAKRGISVEAAEGLLADNEAAIRLEGLRALVRAGRNISEAEARRVLVKLRPGGLLSGLGGDYDRDGEAALDEFRSEILAGLPEVEVSAIVDEASVYDEVPYLARADKFFSKFGDELRRNVADLFQDWFSSTLDRMVNKGWSEDSIQKSRALGDFLKKQMTRKGLDIICRKEEASDLSLVRDMLRSGAVVYSENDMRYLQKFGEWADILLILSALDRPDYSSASSMLLGDDKRFLGAAKAIYHIGKQRLADLVALEAPAQIIGRLVLLASTKSFRQLSNVAVCDLLNSKDDFVRKAVALKCTRTMTKSRLDKILTLYVEVNEFRYYNVIHWLDFGLSVTGDRCLPAVDRVILTMH